jgi:acetylornithine aminotransferase
MKHILHCHDIVKTDFVRGENCSLFDQQGKRYIDFESGCWCTALGYGHPRINQIMAAQIGKLIHLGTRYPNLLAEAAAVDVLEIVGIDDGKCVFLSSGSEAVEFGVQTARRLTGKPLLLTFSSSYHGALGSAGRMSEQEWRLFDWNLGAPADTGEPWREIPFESLGGFVLEPGGSSPGFVRFPPGPLVREIAQRVHQAGGLLVANEVTTGMGRTGKWFGFQHYDVQPDIVAMGKGLGNGYPVSAVAMKREVAEKLESSGFHYVQSHQNDPLGAAVAKEVIAILREGNWVERGNAVGTRFLDGLKRLEKKHAIVKEARGRGLLLALELRPHESFSAASAYHVLLEKGFLVGLNPAGNLLRFDPALTVKEKDIRRLLECMDSILETAS